MGSKADLRRRSLGAAFLLAALAMLVAGQTLLRDSFSPAGFLVYWLLCFAFTFLAILVALWDLATVRRRTREEQRALLEDTFSEIAQDRKSEPERGQRGGGLN